MTNPRKEKIEIANAIVALLNKFKRHDRNALVASLSLETGFTTKLLQGIIDNLLAADRISAEGNILFARKE